MEHENKQVEPTGEEKPRLVWETPKVLTLDTSNAAAGFINASDGPDTYS